MDKRSIRPAVGVSLAVLVMAAASVHGRGQSENVNSSAKGEVVADENIAYWAVSSELARIAEDSSDAILMLAAARLQAMTVTQEVTRSKDTEGGYEEAAGDRKPQDADLYALAERYAGTNEELHGVFHGGFTRQRAWTTVRQGHGTRARHRRL